MLVSVAELLLLAKLWNTTPVFQTPQQWGSEIVLKADSHDTTGDGPRTERRDLYYYLSR
jgi:hypothetical protein